MKKRYFLIPLALFLILAAFLAVGLNRDPHEVPSPLVGKPAPMFVLPRLDAEPGAQAATFGPKDMAGKVWLLNVWASWCAACRDEHPHLLAFARTKQMPLIGLNYKDKREDGLAWLARFGDPYDVTLFDGDGRIGIEFGVYGAPETFIIDKQGVIRFKHIGAVTPQIIDQRIVPLLKDLNG